VTLIFLLNGKSVGKVISSPSGTPYIDPEVFGVLRHLPAPVPILPFINPGAFNGLMQSLPPMMVIPGMGVLTTQRLS